MPIYAIDDEPLMLEALEEAIRAAAPQAALQGFRRVSDLLEAFRRNPASPVFLDIDMPVMDGMTVARKLLEMDRNTDIIFVTGFDQYKGEAMDLHAASYVTKPVTEEKVREALRYLRHPMQLSAMRLRAVTFGGFTLYADGKPVAFRRKKSEELLAYLIAECGAVVSRSRLSLDLFEEGDCADPKKKLENAVYTLVQDLKAVQAEGLLLRTTNGLAIDRRLLDADLFRYLQGQTHLFHGRFLEHYSWSEQYGHLFWQRSKGEDHCSEAPER